MYEKTRFVSGESSAPPIKTASAAFSDDLEILEVVDERVHDEREHALAAERCDRSIGRRLHLGYVELDPHPLQRGRELRLRTRGGVRDEAEPVARAAQLAHRLGRSRDWLA